MLCNLIWNGEYLKCVKRYVNKINLRQISLQHPDDFSYSKLGSISLDTAIYSLNNTIITTQKKKKKKKEYTFLNTFFSVQYELVAVFLKLLKLVQHKDN